MKRASIFALVLSISSCAVLRSPAPSVAKKSYFEKEQGCFLLYNLTTQRFEKKLGQTCEVRYPACSTFKVPLAIMAFDSGVLTNEHMMYRWDGQKRFLPEWNKDHNAESWMSYSVVWFSQRLTPEIGQKKVGSYLQKFHYGNQDLSSGLTTAWLYPPGAPSLAISAYEQVEFMKKLWTDSLPVSPRSMELTRKITFLEISPRGFQLSGKTGSNKYEGELKGTFGWFVGHVKNQSQEYIVVTNVNEFNSSKDQVPGGSRAKDLTKTLLKDFGLW